MTQSESILIAPLPKWVVKFGTPIAAIALTSFFILLGFPYHHLTNRIAASFASSIGVEIESADSGLTFGLAGPGFEFEDIRIETQTGDVYRLDDAQLGPAWSLSWFTGTPTLFYEAHSVLGESQGTVRTGAEIGWEGSIANLTLADLTFLETMLPFSLTGTLSAEGDVQSPGGVPQGPLSFDLHDGVLGHPNLPQDVPYKTIQGKLAFGGEQRVSVETFELTGPLVTFSAAGSVGQADTMLNSPLDIDITLKNVRGQMRSIVQLMGGRVEQDGSSKMHIGGTFNNPIVK
jgi:type II secretion system protein N